MTPESATNSSKTGGQLTLARCEIVLGQLRKRGEPFTISVKDAVRKFSKIVLNGRVGNYIGLRHRHNKTVGFLLVNNVEHGKISWLLTKQPELESSIKEVYIIKDIDRPRNVLDPNSLPGGSL